MASREVAIMVYRTHPLYQQEKKIRMTALLIVLKIGIPDELSPSLA
jgi:hypothetical protein